MGGGGTAASLSNISAALALKLKCIHHENLLVIYANYMQQYLHENAQFGVRRFVKKQKQTLNFV